MPAFGAVADVEGDGLGKRCGEADLAALAPAVHFAGVVNAAIGVMTAVFHTD